MTEQQAIKRLKSEIEWESIELNREAFGMGINALKEIQQYRAIENELKEKYHANVDIKMLMKHFIETIFKGEKHEGFCILTNEDAKEWEQFKALGTVEEIQSMKDRVLMVSGMCKDYYEIGTIEELQALKEKSVAKKPKRELVTDYNECIAGFSYDIYLCPTCNASIEPCEHYCECGQHLDWE